MYIYTYMLCYQGKPPGADAQLYIRPYTASDGEEVFISYESKDEKVIYGFARYNDSSS